MKIRIGYGSSAIMLGICISLLSGCAPKRNLAGTWIGSIRVRDPRSDKQTEIPLTFSVTKKDDTHYSATIDSPIQLAKGIVVESFTLEGDKVTMSSAKVKATYDGKANADGTEITGNWSQSNMVMPLDLKKQPDSK